MFNDFTKDPEKLLTRIEYLEENRRFVQNMLEMAISLVDFQENIVSSFGPENILEEAEKRDHRVVLQQAKAEPGPKGRMRQRLIAGNGWRIAGQWWLREKK